MTEWAGNRNAPAVKRLAAVAEAVGESLRARVVFIGAAVLPLLETEADVLGSLRPTKDVDGVIATTTYTQKAKVEEELRERRFRHMHEPPTHADRWRAPDGTIFDLVGCGAHTGGTGSAHDAWVIETSVTADLPPTVRHASAVGLLLLKCGAYGDRGRQRPPGSKDLADIVTLCATRPSIVEDVRAAPDWVGTVISDAITGILDAPRSRSAVATHVGEREPLIPDLVTVVEARLHELARRARSHGSSV